MTTERHSKRLLYYQWYVSDYLSDLRVGMMSHVQECCYRRLLDYAWQFGQSGDNYGLPDDHAFLAACCRMPPEQFDREVFPMLFTGQWAVFRMGPDERWINKRQAAEYAHSCSKVDLTKQAADVRWSGAGHVKRTRTPKASPSGTVPFEDFWAIYPNKKSKGQARKTWTKLAVTPELFERMRAALALQCADPEWRKEKGRFVPHPSTWLNAERWEDQAATAPTTAARDPDLEPLDVYYTCRECGLFHSHRYYDPEVCTGADVIPVRRDTVAS